HNIFEEIKSLFRKIVEETPEKIKLLPYAYEISEWIYENYYSALLTGNIMEVAYMKLKPFGLDKFFPVGAFGNEKRDRTKLVPIAIKRAKEYYKVDEFEEVLVLGDSHRDIIAANSNNLKSIIVLTGKLTKEELEPYKPYCIIENLSFLPGVVKSIESNLVKA
ncbi:HAD hydrolase-like protein, partial [Fervidobacterium sp.]